MQEILSPMSPENLFSLIRGFKNIQLMKSYIRDLNPEFTEASLTEIIIVGASFEGRKLAEICESNGISVSAVVDDNPMLRNAQLLELHVKPVDSLKRLNKSTPVIIASHRTLDIKIRLKNMGFSKVAPLMLLQCLYPEKFSPHDFHKELQEDIFENIDEYHNLYISLSDQKSRDTLLTILIYRLLFDPLVLTLMSRDDLYAPTDIFSLSDAEVYIDGGAFDGDSIRMFLERTKNKFERVIGFEPDPTTFESLSLKIPEGIEIANLGLSSAYNEVFFEANGNRLSAVSTNGHTKATLTDLDSFLNGSVATYIKLNIEGEELDALQGAKKTITQYSPKLAVSAYHRPNHIWKIPLYIKSINPKYRTFLRQHEGGIVETVLYFVI